MTSNFLFILRQNSLCVLVIQHGNLKFKRCNHKKIYFMKSEKLFLTVVFTLIWYGYATKDCNLKKFKPLIL